MRKLVLKSVGAAISRPLFVFTDHFINQKDDDFER